MSAPEARIKAFSPTLAPADVADLRDRLTRTRWLDSDLGHSWDAGTSPAYLRAFTDYWRNEFSFDAFREDLAGMPHHIARLNGQAAHFIHARSTRPGAEPLLLTHGWPSSFLEYTGLIEALTHPPDSTQQAFHLVIPSLPGFGYSSAAAGLESYEATSIADLWAAIMQGLGYAKFFASGADIGARITGWLAVRHPQHVLGIYVSTNVLQMTSTPESLPGVSPYLSIADRLWLKDLEAWERSDGAYEHLQRTKPMTLAAGLNDSPAGLASWIIEKWHEWAPALDLGSPEVMNLLARHITLYWSTQSILTSFMPYYVYDRGLGARPPGPAIDCPVGLFVSDADIGGIPPRSFVNRQLVVSRWTKFATAGHFPAVEDPLNFANDLRHFTQGLAGASR